MGVNDEKSRKNDTNLRDRLAQLLAKLHLHHEPAWLRLTAAHLRILDEVRRILVERTQVRLALAHNLHDACDARNPALLAAASVEEGEITELHVLQVLAGGSVANTVPRLGAALGAKVVDRELRVELCWS